MAKQLYLVTFLAALLAVSALVSAVPPGVELPERPELVTCRCSEVSVSESSPGLCVDRIPGQDGLCTYRNCVKSEEEERYMCDSDGEYECMVEGKLRMVCNSYLDAEREIPECLCGSGEVAVIKKMGKIED